MTFTGTPAQLLPFNVTLHNHSGRSQIVMAHDLADALVRLRSAIDANYDFDPEFFSELLGADWKFEPDFTASGLRTDLT